MEVVISGRLASPGQQSIAPGWHPANGFQIRAIGAGLAYPNQPVVERQ